MPSAVSLRKEIADDRLGRQCRECDGRDEFLAGRRDDDLHLMSELDELAYECLRFVGCNASCDSEYDVHFSSRYLLLRLRSAISVSTCFVLSAKSPCWIQL